MRLYASVGLVTVMERDSVTESSLTVAIVEKVAAREGVEPTELRPPLHDVIDPDALAAVFAPTERGDDRAAGRVEFDYCGYAVVVRSDGRVRIEDGESRRGVGAIEEPVDSDR